jgi:hypothetical protein
MEKWKDIIGYEDLYNVDKRTISNIKLRKSWVHI